MITEAKITGCLLVGCLAVWLSGCAKNVTASAPVAGATGNNSTGITVAADTLEALCEAYLPFAPPEVAPWISLCPTAVTTVTDALLSAKGLSDTGAAVSGLQQILDSAPATNTLTGKAPEYVNGIAGAIQTIIQILQASHTGARLQTLAPYASAFVDSPKPQLSAAEKQRLKAIRKRAIKLQQTAKTKK